MTVPRPAVDAVSWIGVPTMALDAVCCGWSIGGGSAGRKTIDGGASPLTGLVVGAYCTPSVDPAPRQPANPMAAATSRR